MGHGNQRPEIELLRAFMPVLVASNFYDDSIKNEWARAANPVVSGPIWSKFELVRDFMHVLITCKYKKDRIKKQPRKGGDIIFPIISQWGLSVAM